VTSLEPTVGLHQRDVTDGTHPFGADLQAGSSEGFPWVRNLSDVEFRHTWSWRRSWCASPTNRSLQSVNVGDVTQQNLGNDLDAAYLLLPIDDVRAEAASGRWQGGVNLTALDMLEQRAYGWFTLLKSSAANLSIVPNRDRLALNRAVSGTEHGLSKMVYWRDTRRAVGVDGFKLLHTQLRDNNDSLPTGESPASSTLS
jgi:hypothetical protein